MSITSKDRVKQPAGGNVGNTVSSKNLNETSGTHGTHKREINIMLNQKADYGEEMMVDTNIVPIQFLIKSPGRP